MDVKEIGRRIREARKELGITQKELALRIGVAASTITRYERGEFEDIKIPIIGAIAKSLGVNPLWLCLQTNAKGLIRPLMMYTTVHYAEGGLSAGDTNDIEGIKNLPDLKIPDVLMGKYRQRNDILIASVNGDSMNRVIPDGSKIAILTGIDKEEIHNDDIVVVFYNGGFTVKRFYNDGNKIILSPDSTDRKFQPIVIPNNGDFQILGKVVLYFSEV